MPVLHSLNLYYPKDPRESFVDSMTGASSQGCPFFVSGKEVFHLGPEAGYRPTGMTPDEYLDSFGHPNIAGQITRMMKRLDA